LTSKGGLVISALNRLVDLVEERLGEEPDLAGLARTVGTTEYHLRRMFSSLAGMPLSEYVRRRRMTVAAADVVGGRDDLLSIAVRHGYGSSEAFGRAFRAVHGAGPGQARRDGGPLRTQPQLRFRLTVEGSTPMEVRIVERPAFRLVGHAARVPLIHHGVNPHVQRLVAALPQHEHDRLKSLGDTEPAGLLAVSDDLDPDRAEGSPLTYLHGVAVTGDGPAADGLDTIDVPAGTWAVFGTTGPYPQALQDSWAETATQWFPSNPWRLRPGPEIVAVLQRADDFSTATCELWLPVEPA
jgi:AraC family transcriptional regulator